MILGAHVSTSGGLRRASEKANALGCTGIQIFVGSPSMWKKPVYEDAEVREFQEKNAAYGIRAVFIHALYLANIATINKFLWERSVDFLVHSLRVGERIGAQGVIVHPGSYGDRTPEEGMAQVLAAVKKILKTYEGPCRLLLETTAGMGHSIGSRFEEMGTIFRKAGRPSGLGLCLDTAHVFEAGYDVSSAAGLKKTMEELVKNGLNGALHAIHANDSRTALASHVDRHENIGEGEIGREGFRRLLHQPLLRDLPWLLETPGFDHEGPDLKNMRILKKLSQQTVVSR